MITITLCPPMLYSSQRMQQCVSLGVLSLAAVIRNAGHKVAIRDISTVCTDVERLRAVEDFAGHLLADKPDIIGFSTLYNSYPATLRLARACKALRPEVRVVFGGPQASATAMETMTSYPEVDWIICGEAEASILPFLREFEFGGNWKTVPGLVWRDGGRLFANEQAPLIEDLDILPLPAYDLNPFFIANTGSIPVEAGRGCTYRCSYCSTSRFWSHRVRMKSARKLLEQTNILASRYKTRNIKFVSDNFTNSSAFCLEFCGAAIAAGARFIWGASSRVDAITPGLASKMAEAGCRRVFLGIDTGTRKVSEYIGKRPLSHSQVTQNVSVANAAGIQCTASFIIGFPSETLSDIKETLTLLLDLKAAGNGKNETHLHILAPHPGTPLAQATGQDLEFDGVDWDHFASRQFAADKEMVDRHPKIFTAFYDIRTAGTPKPLLRNIYRLMTNLAYFPDTLMLLWRRERLRFLDALLSQAAELPGESYDKAPAGADELAPVTVIYRFLQGRLLPQLGEQKDARELLRYEYTVNGMPLRSRPLIETFSHDVLRLSAALRCNALPAEAAARQTTVFFLANGEEVRTFHLSWLHGSRLRARIAGLFFKCCSALGLLEIPGPPR